jgi:hypothetical protein
LLNIIIKTPFAIKDILAILSQNLSKGNTAEAFQMLIQGEALSSFMEKKGLKSVSDHDESRLVRLAYHDVTSEFSVTGKGFGFEKPQFAVTLFPEEAFNIDENALYSLSGTETDYASLGITGIKALHKPSSDATSQNQQQRQQRQPLKSPRIQARPTFHFSPRDFLAPPSEWTNAFAFQSNTNRRGYAGNSIVRGPAPLNALMQQPYRGGGYPTGNARADRFNEM